MESLYEIASDEHVGPACGWEPHRDIEESQHILRNILVNEHTFAIILKEHNKVIGNIGFITMPGSKYCENELQHEIGFLLGYSYWGNGYMPDACKCLMMYGFEQLKLEKIICTHVIENYNSESVQKKCNFKYAYTDRFFHKGRNREVTMIVNFKVTCFYMHIGLTRILREFKNLYNGQCANIICGLLFCFSNFSINKLLQFF
ncbi:MULTISPECIES: GNAT family N-acetyltransferase [unclassified Clostridium]|uniref:GNAT family N-acetyltransferase n=1 Tax=unclassified Clostridium TaxID=2614128 RepID=UPI0002981604|nr:MULTISPECIES: GNAT family N-acetyltransferase [unclassified Clostridium]EKQ56162.1 MAG: acetyltransferase, ribosomal protein N-acetylase [Clostridium sp. Maddingley MBC34-26]